MADHRDYVALEWVAGEIAESLRLAVSVLEEYIGDRNDTTRLHFCQAYVHQVQGSLHMVEFFGAALLAEEMEACLSLLQRGELTESQVVDALDALRLSIAELPRYLERVRQSHRDDPALLLRLLNELRAVRGLPLLSGNALLFSPVFPATAAEEAPAVPLKGREFFELARKLRQMYQIALLGYLRGQDVRKNLNYLGKVCVRVARLSQGRPAQDLWQVCIALVEGLLNHSVKGGVAVRSLLRRVDGEIRALVDRGDGVLDEPPPADLLRNLLFYIAIGRADSRYIGEVRARFGLEQALPDGGEDPQRALLDRRRQLSAEIGQLAQTLEAGGDRAALRQRADELLHALAILGCNSEYKVLRGIHDRLAGDSASTLEQALRALAQQLASAPSEEPRVPFNGSDEAQQQLDRAFTSVVRESRNGLELAREGIVNFVANQWQTDYLADVPPLLSSIAGGLVVAEMARAAAILQACERFIREQLLEDPHVPDWQTLDALADALISVDYYLERRASDVEREADDVLTIAEQCVAALGYPVTDAVEERAPAAEVIPLPTADRAAAEEVAPNEPAEPPAAEAEAPEADDVDPEVVEIFIEEADEVLDTIRERLPEWRRDPANADCLTEIRRAFHTLKGSGRMVGAEQIGELAWAVEDMLNRLIEGGLQMDELRLELVERAAALVPDLVADFGAGRQLEQRRLDPLIAAAQALAVEQSPQIDWEPAAEAEEEPAAAEGGEDTLLNIFTGEARIHLQAIENFLAGAEAPAVLTDALQRSLHTLKGAANMAQMTTIAEIVTPVEKLVKEWRALQLTADVELLALLNDVAVAVRRSVDALDAGEGQDVAEREIGHRESLLRRVDSLMNRLVELGERAQQETASLQPGDLDRFMVSAAEYIGAVQEALPVDGDTISATEFNLLGGQIGVLADRAEALNFDAVAELAHELQVMLQHATDPVPDGAVALAGEACEHLMEQLNQLAGDQKPEADGELLDRLQNFDYRAASTAAVDTAEASWEETEVIEYSVPADAEPEAEPEATAASGAEPEPRPEAEAEPAASEPEPATAEASVDETVDPEILAIFLEEAEDLLEAVDEAIHKWSEDRQRQEHLEDLQRHLHTLKGGARLAGLMRLGDLTHAFEAHLIDVLEGSGEAGEDFLSTVLSYQDRLVAGVEAASGAGGAASPEQPPTVDGGAAEVEAEVQGEAGAEAPETMPAQRQPERPDVRENREAALAKLESFSPQEMIKVSSDLMENLVNLAGETSIARSRAEEQVNDFIYSLDEMLITVERLQEQVRRLDIETEAQILFRQEQVESEGQEGFDPLEFDRYSQLQQLSRSLMESASDLTDIRSTLADKTRDMETLLLQQSRINTELQEGLMRSRMVHFSRMVPRLRRIVRQISLEVGKKVEFKVYNADGELDRQVLERMVPPLEHMLRNAVDHGIEPESQRLAAGKAPVGSINMHFAREGGDVLLTLVDDGGGIDFEAVRRKAETLGWLKPGQPVTQGQLTEFLFQPGFSTAEKVTQISGRGVGMDVVYSEIKQLGGGVELESTPGRGTRFTIRLPFTVSVNRALMVSVGGDIFAIPINAIEGIVRVSPYELEVYYQPDAPPFEYAGQSYTLLYLGALLRTLETPHLEGQTEPRPVILVRGGDSPTAVQVDSLLGSREIVVKALGPQFSAVQGLSGATVLGDGSVVVILNVLAMLRADLVRERELIEKTPKSIEKKHDNLLVMVVDDSVTVRKVTSRLLERQGMEVQLAKDGVDAITQLQEAERLPDVMLLDIEMPRMDGFEVASRMQHTSRLQDIPIIMITSRTGEKHRERAFGLGVDKFLGKPYQEITLLQAIAEVTGEHA